MTSRYPNRRWCIITSAEVTSLPVDFSKVMETSSNTLRYSVDGTKTFVKYEGAQPSFLSGKQEYTHSEILAILSGPEWTTPEVIEEPTPDTDTTAAADTDTTAAVSADTDTTAAP